MHGHIKSLYTSKTLDTLDITSTYWKFAKSGLYPEISPRGANLGVWTKEGGGPRAEAQWYHVRCYTLGGRVPPPLKYGPEHGRLGDVSQ